MQSAKAEVATWRMPSRPCCTRARLRREAAALALRPRDQKRTGAGDEAEESAECGSTTKRAGASRARLAAVLSGIEGPLAVAVSGGVDSLTLATFAHRAAASRVEMFHAVSPAVPGDATARVERLAAAEDWRLRIVDARRIRR